MDLLKSFDKIHNSISETSKDKNSQVEEESLLNDFTKNLKSNILEGAQLQKARIEKGQDEKFTQSSIL